MKATHQPSKGIEAATWQMMLVSRGDESSSRPESHKKDSLHAFPAQQWSSQARETRCVL